MLFLALALAMALAPHGAAGGPHAAVRFYTSAQRGSDQSPGTSAARPFRTLGRCLRAVFAAAHDQDATCVAGAGTYRESVDLSALTAGMSPNASGTRTLTSTPGVVPVLSGLDPLPALEWTRRATDGAGCVWAARVSGDALRVVNASTKQLFYHGHAMVEARYPNLDITRSLAVQSLRPAESWVRVGKGSAYGTIVDPGLAAFAGAALNGARATLNVAHQFFTWTRKVANFSAGSRSFHYPKNLPGGAATWDPRWWGNNQYFLSGVPALLDAPGEWVFDEASSSILFWPPPATEGLASCTPPNTSAIEVKTRDYVLAQVASLSALRAWPPEGTPAAEARQHDPVVRVQSKGPTLYNFVLDGLSFFGATFSLGNCHGCRVANTRVVHPSHDPDIPEMRAADATPGPSHAPGTLVSGDGNLVENVTVALSNNRGISFSGSNGLLRNCVVAFTDYLGTLGYGPLSAYGTNLTLTRVTAYAFGNAGIKTYTPVGTTYSWEGTLDVSYSHVHGGGRVGRDHALLYTGGEPGHNQAGGVRWHHNLVHNTTEKCMRADDLSYGTTMDHNVVWHCGIYPDTEERSSNGGLGITPKGNGHLLFANTIFSTNITDLCVPSCPRAPYAEQNSLSQVFNTVARRDHGSPCSCNQSYTDLPGGNQSGIYSGTADFGFVDPASFDFRPRPDSPLVDAGVVFPPYTDGYSGAAPDIGAMEHGEPAWSAGCLGLVGCADPELLLDLE